MKRFTPLNKELTTKLLKDELKDVVGGGFSGGPRALQDDCDDCDNCSFCAQGCSDYTCGNCAGTQCTLETAKSQKSSWNWAFGR